MDGVIVRPASAGDAPALTACIADAYAVWFERLDTLPDVTGGVAESIQAKTVIVCEVNGNIAGGVVADLSGLQIGKIENLAVKPGHAGQGIGRALLARVEVEARNRGIGWLGLATHAEMARTLAFYRTLHWRETGRDGHRVYLEKRLGVADDRQK